MMTSAGCAGSPPDLVRRIEGRIAGGGVTMRVPRGAAGSEGDRVVRGETEPGESSGAPS